MPTDLYTAADRLAALTPRQREVLELVADHDPTYVQAGRALYLSPDTVHGILRRVYQALGVRSRVGAVGVLWQARLEEVSRG